MDILGYRFNIFSLLRVNHYENTHSRIIAEFLNPTGTHGLQSKFLEYFVEMLKNKANAEFLNSTKTHDLKSNFLERFIETLKNKADTEFLNSDEANKSKSKILNSFIESLEIKTNTEFLNSNGIYGLKESIDETLKNNSELLNCNEMCELKSKIRKCANDILSDMLTLANFNHQKAKVYTEYSTEHGRMDIVIEDD
ncbi:PD-(D/E)XK nuclease family protein [Riemerella columbipharyngis]|uniref:PD-(D/E)XK nuclease family protein n=1 Tax=Riemerella columbipharyngis TaxID=1071918 RepID=UPI001C8866D5|nr:PD-(D/E)XK nuclease family protein [Riemerella columbipharyngis]